MSAAQAEVVDLAERTEINAWEAMETCLDRDGWALLPMRLTDYETDFLAKAILSGPTVAGDRPLDVKSLPEASVDAIRQAYGRLSAIANRWSTHTAEGETFPSTLDRQTRTQLALVANRTPVEGFQPLNGGATQEKGSFPIQLVVAMGTPGTDYTGGQLVLTEQRPRMQTRPTVVPVHKGDIVVIPVGPRPFKGTKGYYRVFTRHAISRVIAGERLGLELFFRP